MTISIYSAWPVDALCQHGICVREAVTTGWEPTLGKALPMCEEHSQLAKHRRSELVNSRRPA